MLLPAIDWDYYLKEYSSNHWVTSYFYTTEYIEFVGSLPADQLVGWPPIKKAYVIYPTGCLDGLVPDFGFIIPDTVAYQQIPLYRFARKDVHAHFFTANEEEKNAVLTKLSHSFEFQGVSQYVVSNYTLNAKPVYRMYNSLSGAHFYTANKNEVFNVLTNLDFFSLEGVAFFVFLALEPGTVPVYRFYAPETASHFFTASEAEKNTIMSSVSEDILKYEGVAWFAYPASE
jgi:hypothetical protein